MLEVLNTLTEHGPVLVIIFPASAYCVYLSQQILNRASAPALQCVVQRTDNFCVIPVFFVVAHGEIVFQASANVQTAPYCLKIVYAIRLLKGMPEMRLTVRRISDKIDTLLNWTDFAGGRPHRWPGRGCAGCGVSQPAIHRLRLALGAFLLFF